MPLVADRIRATGASIRERHNGRLFKEKMLYLSDIEPEAAAAISCKVTFDKVFGHKPKSNLVQNVTDAIGTAVENECMMRYYERNVPGLLKYIKDKYWHKASGTHQGEECNRLDEQS